jgi:hypothetical protein
MQHRLLCFIVILSLCGCQALSEDVEGTIEADYAQLGTEAAELSGVALARRTEVAATVEFSGTRIAEDKNINQQIFATLAAGSTPTVALVAGQAQADVRMDAMAAGFDLDGRLFIKTGVSDTVDSNTGCVVNPRSSFPPDTPALYATVEVFNIRSGTPMRAAWFYEGEPISQEDRVIGGHAEVCLWFRLDQTQTSFRPGTWSVILYADAENFQLEDPMTFFIVEQ